MNDQKQTEANLINFFQLLDDKPMGENYTSKIDSFKNKTFQEVIIHTPSREIKNPNYKEGFNSETITIPAVLQVVNKRKTHRNDLCPCGSGRKHKHCHQLL